MSWPLNKLVKLTMLWTTEPCCFGLYLQALRYLGIEPTQEQEAEMMSKLQIDPLRTVNYGGKNSIVLSFMTKICLCNTLTLKVPNKKLQQTTF